MRKDGQLKGRKVELSVVEIKEGLLIDFEIARALYFVHDPKSFFNRFSCPRTLHNFRLFSVCKKLNRECEEEPVWNDQQEILLTSMTDSNISSMRMDRSSVNIWKVNTHMLFRQKEDGK